MVKWPIDGFRSNKSFINLQHESNSTFNQIYPLDLVDEDTSETKEIVVVMTNDERYTIRSTDYDSIISLIPGQYAIEDTDLRRFDLIITECDVNNATKDALRRLNNLIQKVNASLVSHPHKRSVFCQRFRSTRTKVNSLVLLESCRISGRLTKHTAALKEDILAIAYKLDGRKMTALDAAGIMAQDMQEMQGVCDYYRRHMDEAIFNTHLLKQASDELSYVETCLANAESVRKTLLGSPATSDEPITRVIHTGGTSEPAAKIFHTYKAWLDESPRLLIESERDEVTSVSWYSNETAEVTLMSTSTRFFVSPLEHVEECRLDDEIRIGDTALLVGAYLVIAESATGHDGERNLFMTNWLRINGEIEGIKSHRRRNRAAGPSMTISCFL